MNKPILLLFLILLHCELCSQEIIEFNNPSFEAELEDNKTNLSAQDIVSWDDCASTSFQGQSPFDVQPGYWGVSLKPKHGSSYIGLITRKNETYESIGQKITKPLKSDVEYSFSIYIATSFKENEAILSPNYVYYSSNPDDNPFAVHSPAILRIRLTNTIEKESDIVYNSHTILNNEWELLEIKITPKFNADYIIFEAYFPNSDEPTYGNILIDAININNTDIRNRDID